MIPAILWVASGLGAISGPPELHEAALRLAGESRLAGKQNTKNTTLSTFQFVLEDGPSFPPPAAGEKRIRVGGNVMAKKLLHKVNPLYPPEAKEAGIEGVVQLQVLIAADGTAKDILILNGDAVLAQAAAEAVKQWVWEQTLLNGDPVEVIAQVDVNYTLAR